MRTVLSPLSFTALAAMMGFMAGAAIRSAPGAQSGGIVPTEYHPALVQPGPEPDLTFFATGETMGKIEPCG
ncbi:MAG: hypothetical protein ACE5HD_06885 [Acidobacteriota bacterium]